MSRLSIVAVVMAVVAALTNPRAAMGTAVRVADDVFLLPGTLTPGHQPDGNSVIFAGPRGLVVVDTGRHQEHTLGLIDFAGSRSQDIVAVVNTHWHLDHLGGNALLRARVPGLKVIASNAVAPALSGWLADSRRDMQALLDRGGADPDTQAMLRTDIALIDAGPRLLPDVALDGPLAIDDTGRQLQIGFERDAVTAGDLWVYDPASRVIAAGDLVTLPAPFLDTACAPRWRAAVARLDALPFATLVPGHGAPMAHAEFSTWRRAFDALLDCAAGKAPATTCSETWIAALGALLPETEQPRARGMVGYYIDQHLRAEPGQRDRFCPAHQGDVR